MPESRRRIAAILFPAIMAVCSFVFAGENAASDPALLRQRLLDSVGNLPWNLTEGYVLKGQFTLKATGEEIGYRASYARSSSRWAADFSQENRSRNLRYVFSGTQAWVSSPEITADIVPGLLPYIAQFDFPLLYAELLRILEQGNRDPRFNIRTAANEVYVRGKLQNGWEATFILNTVEYFPRKIIVTGSASTAWLITSTMPDGSCSLTATPGSSSEFEVWFSDPVDAGKYRYARRMDFAERGDVVGTFILEESASIKESDALFNRPPKFPWLDAAVFDPHSNSNRPSLYLNSSELEAFRSRAQTSPWSGWSETSSLAAFWALPMLWAGPFFFHSISPGLMIFAGVAVLLGFLILLRRRRRESQRRFPWGLLAAGLFVYCLAFVAEVASTHFHTSQNRSLIALHSAIGYTVTGNPSYAKRADALLRNFAREAPAQSIEDLGHSCQAYALAYDLIRPALLHERRMEIEGELSNYVKPLFGASHGWISNTDISSALSAGLGMVGLAIGSETFITSACEVMRRTFESQLAGGLHQSGPGQGNLALDSAVNLLYALKHTGRADYYSQASFQQYVRVTLQMLSPVGTLPLFGDTNLDQSARLSEFFLKVANRLPEETGRQCIAAHDRYWACGRYHAEGLMKWILPVFQPMATYLENPYVLFQYDRALLPSALPGASAVLGGGQSAVLRDGSSPDSAYLALNMPKSSLSATHRDILAFDLYAHRSLLLHGPGYPGKDHSSYLESTQTAASNSITMNEESQSGTQCTGVETSLLNQPVFDYIRALADKTYDYGEVQRDIVMARSEEGRRAYFFLIDEVFVTDPETTVQWHLHGRGKLKAGKEQIARWTCTLFSPPWWRSRDVSLEAAFPFGMPGKLTQKSGTLYSRTPFLNLDSASAVIEWEGSKRFCTILFPHGPGEANAVIQPLGETTSRIGATDWISLGSVETRTIAGPLAHISEYVIVRSRRDFFPALLMISGLEFRFGFHSLFSNKPVTASLDGLQGGLMNSRPDTQLEIHSPDIKARDRFLLDGKSVLAAEPGVLVLILKEIGEHSLQSTAPRPQNETAKALSDSGTACRTTKLLLGNSSSSSRL